MLTGVKAFPQRGDPIVALTSYHAHTAAILDGAVDFILVGDSLGMVMHGFKNTVPVTLDMMILQGQAVMRGSKTALVVVDLPFGSYEESPKAAFRSAARVMKETGCGAVKLEGGRRMAETIRFLTERGVPVMGHVGLTPQSVNTLGGFRVQGKSKDGADGVAQCLANSANMRLAKTFDGAILVPFDGASDDVFGDMIGALRAGQVDAVVDDDVALIPIAEAPDIDVAFAVETRNPWGMGVRKANDELRETVNAAIARVKTDGRLEAVWAKWVPALRYPF